MTAIRAMFFSGRGGTWTSPGIGSLVRKLESEAKTWVTATHSGPPMLQKTLDNHIADLVAHQRAGYKLVIGGYSLGAMTAIEIAKLLGKNKGIDIDLLVTIVPAYAVISPNVKKATNHTIIGGRFFIWPSDRVDVSGPTIFRQIDYQDSNHVAIQFNSQMHQDVLSEVQMVGLKP